MHCSTGGNTAMRAHRHEGKESSLAPIRLRLDMPPSLEAPLHLSLPVITE